MFGNGHTGKTKSSEIRTILREPDRIKEEGAHVPSSAETLRRALRTTGTVTRLASALEVPVTQLLPWLTGDEMPPPRIFKNALDLVFREPDAEK